MANTAKALFRGLASTSNTTLYTVPSATTAVVTNIVICNTSTTAATARLALDGIELIYDLSIAGNATVVVDVKQVLAATKTISGSASATTVELHISGMEIA